MLAHIIDAFIGERMGLQIRILALRAEEFFLLQDLEELEQPARRLMRAVEEAKAGLVGGCFLGNGKLREGALSDAHPGHQAARTGVAMTGDSCGAAQHHADDAFDHRILHRLGRAGKMTAGDMAGFMGHDPDDLVRAGRTQDRACVHEQILSAGDEGIERRVVDDVDANRLRIEAGCLEDRGGKSP